MDIFLSEGVKGFYYVSSRRQKRGRFTSLTKPIQSYHKQCEQCILFPLTDTTMVITMLIYFYSAPISLNRRPEERFYP